MTYTPLKVLTAYNHKTDLYMVYFHFEEMKMVKPYTYEFNTLTFTPVELETIPANIVWFTIAPGTLHSFDYSDKAATVHKFYQNVLGNSEVALRLKAHPPLIKDIQKIVYDIFDEGMEKSMASTLAIVNKTTTRSELKNSIPALDAQVDCPEAACNTHTPLWFLIQHINDHHKWSRVQIADWLDTLDLDLSFPLEDINA